MQSEASTRSTFKMIPLLVGAVHFLSLFPFARLGVDPHHDGVMLHPALMVDQGFVVHRDVFSQYGPLTSLVQAAFMNLLGPSLWSIRIGSCALLAGTGALLFSLNRRFFGIGIATVASILSLSLTYFFSPTSPMLPWPSDLMIFLVALCGWLLNSGLESDKPRKSLVMLTLAGFVSSLLPFVRQSVGITLLLLALCGAVFLRRRWLLPVFVGISIGIATAIAYFFATDSFAEFWQQSVIGPWRWAVAERGIGGWAAVRGTVMNVGLTGVALLLLGTHLLNQIIRTREANRRSTQFWGLLVLCSVLFTMTQSNGTVLQISREGLLWALGVAGLGSVLFATLRLEGDGTLAGPSLFSTYVLATATVSIFPVTDVRHAYWAFVPLIGTGIFLISRELNGVHARALGGVVLCSLIGFQTIATIQRTVRVPRVAVADSPVLRHMLFDHDYFKFFELRFAQVASFRRLHPDAMVLNICSDGLFASLGAIKGLPDPYFVSWSFGLDFFNPRSEIGRKRIDFVKRERPIVWMCPFTDSPERLSQLYDLRLLANDEKVPTTEAFSWWPYISYLGVPIEWDKSEAEVFDR